MAVNYFDVDATDDLDDVSVTVAGTVTNDVRVVFNDDANLGDVIVAIDIAKANIIAQLE